MDGLCLLFFSLLKKFNNRFMLEKSLFKITEMVLFPKWTFKMMVVDKVTEIRFQIDLPLM